MSEADDLHERLFGFRPKRAGAAYERLAAIVMARLGWTEVRHDTLERPPGNLAEHQLDVTARHPNGEVERLLIECKDWNNTVGKETMDTLVGVRDQIEADAAAVITTKGFTKGARNVAVDQNLAMIRMRPSRPEDEQGFIKLVEIQLKFYVPSFGPVKPRLADDHELPSGSVYTFALTGMDHLLHPDGSAAENLNEVFLGQSRGREIGTFQRAVDFPDGRLIRAEDGTKLPIVGLSWTEVVTLAEETIRVERKGEPCLLDEQLDGNGDSVDGRLLVDADLYAWEIGPQGAVKPRGDLRSPMPSASD